MIVDHCHGACMSCKKTDNSVYVQAIKNLSSFSDPVVISILEGYFFLGNKPDQKYIVSMMVLV